MLETRAQTPSLGAVERQHLRQVRNRSLHFRIRPKLQSASSWGLVRVCRRRFLIHCTLWSTHTFCYTHVRLESTAAYAEQHITLDDGGFRELFYIQGVALQNLNRFLRTLIYKHLCRAPPMWGLPMFRRYPFIHVSDTKTNTLGQMLTT